MTTSSSPHIALADLYALIARFQNLKAQTGTSKSSSYQLNLRFDPWTDEVSVEWGCYDVGNYPRTYCTTTTRDQLIAHLTDEITKMEQVVSEQSGDPF